MYNFPDSPTLNQIVTGPNNQQYKWDGSKWVAQGTATTGPTGPQGPPAGMATVTVAFTTPAINNTVVVSVSDASWIVVNTQLFIVDAYYNVNSIAGNNLTLQRTA